MSRPNIALVDLRAQYLTIKEAVAEAFARVVESNAYILGPETAAFEKEFAAFSGSAHCVGCGNGTDAVALALQAVGVGPGDEVITPSMTFFATSEAISLTGARPVFVDCVGDTLLMDVSKIKPAITERTKALLPVHLYGQMVDMDPLMELARKHGLKVVEDAAQAHGAKHKGQPAGTIGDAGTFSFYPGKNLGAYGDAGAVVTSDESAAAWLRKARNHGRAAKYEHDFEATNSRMDGIQAAVLRAKLPHLADWNSARRTHAALYDELLKELPDVLRVEIAPENESVVHLYVIRVANRDTVLERLKADGVGAGIHYPVPLHRQPAYRQLDLDDADFPVTSQAANEVLSLPLFPEMTEEQIRYIVGVLAKATRGD